MFFMTAIGSSQLMFFYKIIPSGKPEISTNFTLTQKELCSPIIKDNILYQGLHNNLIVSQDIENKKLLWQYRTNGKPTGVILYKDILIVTTIKGNIYALNRKTGGLIWKYDTRKEILSRAVAVNGNVYIQTTLNTLYAFNISDGALEWQYSLGSMSYGLMVHLAPSPYISGDILYTGFSNGNTVAISAVTGKLIWSNKPRGFRKLQDIVTTPAGSRNIVIFGSFAGGLSALNKKDGTLVWERNDLTKPLGLYVTNKTVYVTRVNGDIYRLDLRTGDTIWKTNLGNEVGLTDIQLFHNSILLGAASGPYKGIILLNKDNGRVINHFQIVSGLSAAPIVVNNRIYTVSNGGFLYGLTINPTSHNFL